MELKQSAPKVGDRSPWGAIQSAEPYGTNGAVLVSTASHGGAWVPPDLLRRIPDKWRRYAARYSKGMGDQWYEEDCALAAVALYSEGFEPDMVMRARLFLDKLDV